MMPGRTTMVFGVLFLLLSTGLPGLLGEVRPLADGLPRTVWAPSWEADPIKLLSIGPFIPLHDSHELRLRFPFVVTAVAVTDHKNPGQFGIQGHYWPGLLKTGDRALNEVRQALEEDWDLLALNEVPGWPSYPEDIRTRIIDEIVTGKSLATVLTDGLKAELEQRVQLRSVELPVRFAQDSVKEAPALYRAGKGHVLHLPADRSGVNHHFVSSSPNLRDFDYSIGRAGWYLRQVARPGSEPAIAALALKGSELTVETTGVSALDGGRLHVVVRRRDSHEFFECRPQLTHRNGKISVKWQVLPAGEYHAEVRIVDRMGSTADWDGVRFSVPRSRLLTSVTIEPKTIRAGDRVRCRLKVEDPADETGLYVRWLDRWERLLLEKRVESFTSDIELIAPSTSLSVLNHVRVTLLSKDGPESEAVGTVLMPENVRPAGDFYVLYWRTGGAGHGFLQNDAVRRIGAADAFSNVDVGVGSALGAAEAHL